jgi:hypothetical protein
MRCMDKVQSHQFITVSQMPSGFDQDWIGYTYGKTYRSYYNDEWCGYYTLPFHEVGHNLGLKHSGEVGTACKLYP